MQIYANIQVNHRDPGRADQVWFGLHVRLWFWLLYINVWEAEHRIYGMPRLRIFIGSKRFNLRVYSVNRDAGRIGDVFIVRQRYTWSWAFWRWGLKAHV